jgi:DNA-binding transcriptional MerR regulator
MRISELSRESGVPVATIKFYLREGLLHDGVLTSATQAQYDETHVARLRLVRALIGPGGLSLAAARSLVQAIEDPPSSVHDLLGVAAMAVGRPAAQHDHSRVHDLMRAWGWRVDDKDCETHAALEDALQALDAAGFDLAEGALEVYVQHMRAIAEFEIAAVPTESAAAAVRYVVLGTVLIEPLILNLRRMAQQEESARRFGPVARIADRAPD